MSLFDALGFKALNMARMFLRTVILLELLVLMQMGALTLSIDVFPKARRFYDILVQRLGQGAVGLATSLQRGACR